MSILIADNFEWIDSPKTTGIAALPWANAGYRLYGSPSTNSGFRIQTIGARIAMYLIGKPASTTYAPWVIAYDLPDVLDYFVAGMRVLTPTTGYNESASIGIVANLDANGFDTVTAIRIASNQLSVSYRDAFGDAKTDTVALTVADGAYLDFRFRKASNTAGEMSSLDIYVSNNLVYTTQAFNNVGSRLSLVFGGTIPTTAGAADLGYLNHASFATNMSPSMNYGITDFYVNQGPKRLGNPVVETRNISSATSALAANVSKTALDIVDGPFNTLEFLAGKGTTDVTTSGPSVGAAVVTRVLASANNDLGNTKATMTVGATTKELTLGVDPTAVVSVSTPAAGMTVAVDIQ